MNNINEINSFILCKKCKSIPLIELVPHKNNLKILISCGCLHQQLIKNEIFLKYYYNNNFMEYETKDNDDEMKEKKINNIIKNYQEYKKAYLEDLIKMKEKIFSILKDLEKAIEFMIEQNRNINENIDKVIQIIIKNYRLEPNNKINKKNIINNIHMYSKNNFHYSCEPSFIKSINNVNNIIHSYLTENYIITDNKYKIYQSIEKADLILEINENILAALTKDNSIKLFNIDNYNKIQININNLKNILIDEKKRYLISLEDDYFIKFRDLNDIKNKLIDSKYKELNKDYSPLALYEFRHNDKIINLINLENNLLGLSDGKNFNIYKYDIKNKFPQLINKSDIKVSNIKSIKRKGKIYIIYYLNYYFYILEIPSLIVVNKIYFLSSHYKLVYEQINENELFIGNNNTISIIDLEHPNKINLSKKINFEIMSVKVLKDNTILIGGRSEIRRLFMKTLENLPSLIILDDEDGDDYDNYYRFVFNRNENDVKCINQLSDGKIILDLTYDIKIFANQYE